MEFLYWIKFVEFRFQNPTDIEDKVKHTNVLYGGFQPDVTNVYFTHGSIDPWHHMGVLEDLNIHSPATVVPGLNSNINFYWNLLIIVAWSLFQGCRIVVIWDRLIMRKTRSHWSIPKLQSEIWWGNGWNSEFRYDSSSEINKLVWMISVTCEDIQNTWKMKIEQQ